MILEERINYNLTRIEILKAEVRGYNYIRATAAKQEEQGRRSNYLLPSDFCKNQMALRNEEIQRLQIETASLKTSEVRFIVKGVIKKGW